MGTTDGISPPTTESELRHGEHVDTIADVDEVFRLQRKLSFTYGAVFFIVTLAIPAGSVWLEWWHSTTIWGGFTPNYMFVAILYFAFLWIMAWTYGKQADKLDTMLHLEDAATGEGE